MLENLQNMTRHSYEQYEYLVRKLTEQDTTMNSMNMMLENLQNMTRHSYEQYEYHVRKLTDIGQNSSKTKKANHTDIGQNASKTKNDKLYRYGTTLK